MNETKKDNVVMVLLVIIILLLTGIIVFMLIGGKKDNKKEDNKPTNNATINNNQDVDNKQITDDNKVATKEVAARNYKNYTTASFEGIHNEKYDIKIQNGILNVKCNNKSIKVNGVNDKIKSFIYSPNFSDGVGVVLLAENNNIYIGIYDYSNNSTVFDFEKYNTNLEITNITVDAVVVYLATEGLTPPELFVVLKNKEIRHISFYYNDSDKLEASIDDNDVSYIKEKVNNILVLNDKSLMNVKDFGDNNSKIKYNNDELKADVVFDDYNSADVTKKTNETCIKVISNNKLYKLCGEAGGYNYPNEYNKVSLANKKIIKDYKLDNIKQDDSGYNVMNIVINYTDGSKDEFKDISNDLYHFYEF